MEKIPLNLDTAKDLLFSKMQNQNLRRHCIGVGKTLSEFWDYYNSEGRKEEMGNLCKEEWEIIGLLHDSDYEVTKDCFSKHVVTLIEWLKDYEVKEEVLNALKTHNSKAVGLREPQTLLEWTLECCDELTGFIVAVALILPSKKLSDVKKDSVLKRFGQPAFARAVDRSQITQCEEKCKTSTDNFVEVTLKAMQNNSDILGL
jgi:predicted hydrolase (HD superfamily)